MNFNLKGGVLIIGSLYWQDDLNEKEDKRKNWRNDRLNMQESRDVKLPIRYGRFSGSPEKDNQTYTMLFDNSLTPDQYGIAKVVPFTHQLKNQDRLIREAKEMSMAEGPGGALVKGIKSGGEAWCICAMLINPVLEPKEAQLLREMWLAEIKLTPDPHNLLEEILTQLKEYTLTEYCELDIDWPAGCDEFDFLLATSTRPKLRDGVERLTPKEIAAFVGNRPYFHENGANGIMTYQDENILANLK